MIKSDKKASKHTGSIFIGFLLHLGGPNPSKTLALCIQTRCRRFRSNATFSSFLESGWEVIGQTFAGFFDVVSMSVFNASKMWRKVERSARASATERGEYFAGPLKNNFLSLYPYILGRLRRG